MFGAGPVRLASGPPSWSALPGSPAQPGRGPQGPRYLGAGSLQGPDVAGAHARPVPAPARTLSRPRPWPVGPRPPGALAIRRLPPGAASLPPGAPRFDNVISIVRRCHAVRCPSPLEILERTSRGAGLHSRPATRWRMSPAPWSNLPLASESTAHRRGHRQAHREFGLRAIEAPETCSWPCGRGAPEISGRRNHLGAPRDSRRAAALLGQWTGGASWPPPPLPSRPRWRGDFGLANSNWARRPGYAGRPVRGPVVRDPETTLEASRLRIRHRHTEHLERHLERPAHRQRFAPCARRPSGPPGPRRRLRRRRCGSPGRWDPLVVTPRRQVVCGRGQMVAPGGHVCTQVRGCCVRCLAGQLRPLRGA